MIVSTKTTRDYAVDETARWDLINQWQVTEQSNDRMQQDGRVADSVDAPGGKRSTARRQHQLNYKRWSQERHD
jgi:hypothetical protein